MRNELQPTLVLLSRAADELSKQMLITGNPYYRKLYTQTVDQISTIKQTIIAHERKTN